MLRTVAAANAVKKMIGARAMSSLSFVPTDPLNLESRLTEDERMIRDAAHAFAQVRCYFLKDVSNLGIFRDTYIRPYHSLLFDWLSPVLSTPF